MFHKSRKKIVAAIMGVLTGLFVVTLCVIYFSSYIEVYQKDREMMMLYAEKYWVNGNPEKNQAVIRKEGSGDKQKDIQSRDNLKRQSPDYLQTFYSVLLDQNHVVQDINNKESSDLPDTFFEELSKEILNLKRETGMYGNWVYHVETKEKKTLVVLMDNTVMKQNIRTLFQYTALFGGIALLLLFVLSLYLSKRIILPLEENDRKQKQFLSDVSHELKTPLAVMNTNLDMLEREIGRNKWLSNTKLENERMNELVQQLLYLTRAESAKLPQEKVDFGRIATGSVLSLESLAFEKNSSITSSIPSGIFVMGNQGQLQQLVSILVENAISHSAEGVEIDVNLSKTQGKVKLCVKNPGEPFSEKEKEAIFQRFYREDFARSSDSGHYGLGLAIARTIIQGHRGTIEVLCENGQIVFQVTLPAWRGTGS